MEKITLEIVRLIAIDDGAKEIVERLKGYEIYHIESGCDILLDVVITTFGKSIDKSSIPRQGKIAACKTILLQANDAYEAIEHDGFDAILSFSDLNKVYEEVKSFLYIVYNSLEVHGLCSFDFYDFFSLVKGRNMISLQTYPYTSIGQALSLFGI